MTTYDAFVLSDIPSQRQIPGSLVFFQLRQICDVSDSTLAECYRRFLGNRLLDGSDKDWALDSSKHCLVAKKKPGVIRYRLTSRPNAEAVCLAGLLG